MCRTRNAKIRMSMLMALIAALLLPAAAWASSVDTVEFFREYYVDVNWEGAEKGTKEAPFRSLTRALAAVEASEADQEPLPAPGDVKMERRTPRNAYLKLLDGQPYRVYGIRMADGVYDRKVEDFGEEGLEIKHPVVIRGGMGRTGAWREDHPAFFVNRLRLLLDEPVATHGRGTVFDMGGQSRGLRVTGSHLFRLEGCTFRNGKATRGGAVWINSRGQRVHVSRGFRFFPGKNTVALLIRDCTFERNTASEHGGALSADAGGYPRVVSCTLRYNAASAEGGWGGAIHADGPINIQICKLYGNQAAHGGAIGHPPGARSGVEMVGNVVYANKGQFAIECQRVLRFWKMTVADNHGGGCKLAGGQSMLWVSIISGNEGVGFDPGPFRFNNAGGYFLEGGGGPWVGENRPDVGNHVMWNVNFWDNQGGHVKGPVLRDPYLEVDPQYVDSTNPDLAKRDYSLRPDSPCIRIACGMRGFDAGTAPDGVNVAHANAMDLGAYHYTPRKAGDPPRPEATGPLARKDFYVDLNWKGEEKGTKDAPFRSLGKAMHLAAHDANRNRHDGHSVVLDQFTRLNVIHVADGVYNRSVEEYGTEGLRPMWNDANRHVRFRVQGSYVGLRNDGSFDWSEANRGRRTTILDAEGKSRIFSRAVMMTLENLVVRNGRLAAGDQEEYRNGGGVLGGSIRWLQLEQSYLGLIDCLFENNVNELGPGGAIAGGVGQLFYKHYAVSIYDCDFVNNRAAGDGGALSIHAGLGSAKGSPTWFVIRNSRFKGNVSGGNGGAIHISGKLADDRRSDRAVWITDCVFEDNVAEGTGAALCARGRLIAERCVFRGNKSAEGAVVSDPLTTKNSFVPWTFRECTFTDNQAQTALDYGLRSFNQRDWHLFPDQPGLTLEHCTFADNQAGAVKYTAHPKKPGTQLAARSCRIEGNQGIGLHVDAKDIEGLRVALSANRVAKNKTDYQGLTPPAEDAPAAESVGAPQAYLSMLPVRDMAGIRESLNSDDGAQKIAAMRALAVSPRPEALPALMEGLDAVTNEQVRRECLAGAVRLLMYPAMQASYNQYGIRPHKPESERVELVRALLKAVRNNDEAAVVLGTLTNQRSPDKPGQLDMKSVEALRLFAPYLDKEATRPSAAALIVKVLQAKDSAFVTHRDEAVAAATKALQTLGHAECRAFALHQAHAAGNWDRRADESIRLFAADYVPKATRLKVFRQWWSTLDADTPREPWLEELAAIRSVAALEVAAELAGTNEPWSDAAMDAALKIAEYLRPRYLAADADATVVKLLHGLDQRLADEDLDELEGRDRKRREGRIAQHREKIADITAFLTSIRSTTVGKAQAAPAIDGKLDDAAWKTAKPVTGFKTAWEQDQAKLPTTARFTYDDGHLYVAVRCEEPNTDNLKVVSSYHDMEHVFRDDSIDLFLDVVPEGEHRHLYRNLDGWTQTQVRPEHTPRAYYNISVNAAGTVLDQLLDWEAEIDHTLASAGINFGRSWTSRATVRTAVTDDAWTVEMAIPWSAFDRKAPQPGERLGLNICRNRPLPGMHDRITAWPRREWVGAQEIWQGYVRPRLLEISRWSETDEEPFVATWRHSMRPARYGVAVFE